jgi:hypothetical protein
MCARHDESPPTPPTGSRMQIGGATKRRYRWPVIAVLSLLSVSTLAVAEQQETYRLTHLATGTTFISGFADINNENELAGWRFVDGREVSFIW